MSLKGVKFLFQGYKPAWSQVNVLEQDPSAALGSRVDGLVGLRESFFRSDGNRGHATAQLGCEVVHASRGVKSGHRAHQDRGVAPQLIVDDVCLAEKIRF